MAEFPGKFLCWLNLELPAETQDRVIALPGIHAISTLLREVVPCGQSRLSKRQGSVQLNPKEICTCLAQLTFNLQTPCVFVHGNCAPASIR